MYATFLAAALLAPKAPVESRVPKKDFIISVSMMPNGFQVGLNEDLDQIKKVANTLFVASSQYKSTRKRYLDPLLDAAEKRGLKVVLLYYAEKGGDTTMEDTAKEYGSRPCVIGFKVQDELGSRGQSTEYFVDFLKKMRAAVRKYSDKPIMIDTIPYGMWADTAANRAKYPASSNEAIDRYVNEGLIDILTVSMGKYVDTAMPKVAARWGGKVKLFMRTSAGYKGDSYAKSEFPEDVMLKSTPYSRTAWENGAIGIDYYAWSSGPYKIMDPGLKPNRAFDEMVKNYNWFQN